MQIIHLIMFCVPVSTGASKGNELLKMSLDSISDGVIFQNFLGGMPPDLLVLACFVCLCALHTMRLHVTASPELTMMINLAVPPPFKSLDLPV